MPTIIPLENATQDMVSLVGRKAVQLATLQKHFLVPKAVIITNTLFQQFLEQTGIKKDTEKMSSLLKIKPEEISTAANLLKERILTTSLPEEVFEGIKEAYAMLSSDAHSPLQKSYDVRKDSLVAVRPSPLGYDRKDIHTSILNIRGIDRLQKAILLCWASFFSPTALEYRLQYLSENTPSGFAIILQQMVDSQAAGILHTQYKMNPQEVYIIGCKGLGSALTNGLIAADQYFITKKSLHIAAIERGKQTFMLEREKESDKTIKVYLQSEYAEQQKIADRHLGELTLLSEKIEAFFGKPQVIDFAISNEQIFFLGAYEPGWYKEQMQRILEATNKHYVTQEQDLQEEGKKAQQKEEEISYGIVEELDKDHLVQVAVDGENESYLQKSVILETKQQSIPLLLRMSNTTRPSATIFSPARSSRAESNEPLFQEATEEQKEELPNQYPEERQYTNTLQKAETKTTDVNEIISSIDPFALEQEMANAAVQWEQERSEVRKAEEEQQQKNPEKSEAKEQPERKEEIELPPVPVTLANKRYESELTTVQKAAGTLIIHCFRELKQKLPREQWVIRPELRHITVLVQNYSEKNVPPTKEQVLYALSVVEKLQK